MKRFLPYVMFLLVGCLMACHDKIVAPEDEAKETLRSALEALGNGDYDAYMDCVDYGAAMTPEKRSVMRDVLRQHVGWRTERKGAVASIDIVDAEMDGDSACAVFYRYVYADGTEEMAMQEMVHRDGVWKLKARH